LIACLTKEVSRPFQNSFELAVFVDFVEPISSIVTVTRSFRCISTVSDMFVSVV